MNKIHNYIALIGMLELIDIMETPASRIEMLMIDDKIETQQELASKLEYDTSSISKYLKADNKPSPKFLQNLEDTLGWSARWIRTGEGPKRVSHKPENQLTEGEKVHSPYNGIYRGAGSKLNMWWVPAKAQAGFINGFAKRLFPHQIEKGSMPVIQGECFGFEIEGFSMYPEYAPGSYIVCTTLDDVSWLRKDKIYVFQTADGLIIKYFDRIENDTVYMRSANNVYNPVNPLPLTDVQQLYNIEFNMVRANQ